MQSRGYTSVEELESAYLDAKAKASDVKGRLKATESRLKEVNRQIRLTGQFFANKDIYTEYRKGGKSEEFYEKHRAEISLYESAHDTLRELSGGKKLPSMNAEYEAYQNARAELSNLQTIYTNVSKMLGIEDERKTEREANKGIG